MERDHEEQPPPRRRPTLHRETLRDLTADRAAAAGVRGGTLPGTLTTTQTTWCHNCGPVPDTEQQTRTTISGDDCAPGRYITDYRHWVEHEVLEDGRVIVRSLHARTGDTKQLPEGGLDDLQQRLDES